MYVVWCEVSLITCNLIFIALRRSLDVAKRQSEQLPDPKDRGIGPIQTRDELFRWIIRVRRIMRLNLKMEGSQF